MALFSSVGDYFALDIGTTGVRVVQLSGTEGAWSLARYGYAPIDIQLSNSDSPNDQRKLAEIIATVIGQSGIKSRDVVIGVPSDKTFATVIDMPELPASELATTIKYQAEQYIPMNINDVKVDWALLGQSVNDKSKNEVLLASVSNSFSETRLDLVEGLGLNVLAIEPDALALARSLQPATSATSQQASVIVEIGDFTSDIVVIYSGAPRLIRTIPTGMQTFVKAVSQNLNVKPDQAAQFTTKFGFVADKLEGQVVRAMQSTIDQFVSEIEKSVKFFQTKYPSVKIELMIVSNYGVTIPGLKQYFESKLGFPVQLGNPWQQVRVSTSDQTTLQPLSAQFAVAIGLAQRGVQV